MKVSIESTTAFTAEHEPPRSTKGGRIAKLPNRRNSGGFFMGLFWLNRRTAVLP